MPCFKPMRWQTSGLTKVEVSSRANVSASTMAISSPALQPLWNIFTRTRMHRTCTASVGNRRPKTSSKAAGEWMVSFPQPAFCSVINADLPPETWSGASLHCSCPIVIYSARASLCTRARGTCLFWTGTQFQCSTSSARLSFVEQYFADRRRPNSLQRLYGYVAASTR